MSDQDGHTPMTWPEIGLQPHRFAGIFRMLAGEERENFAADIATNGLKQKVVVFGDAILDGRNRYLVLVDEGVFDPEDEHWRDRPELFTEFEGTDTQALDFVWSLNEQRRHDSASQRAMSAARYANLRGITQAEAADKLGVSERQVSSASKIIAEAEPELVEAVDEGRVPAYLAEQLVDLDEEDQREVAEKPKGEASAAARQKLQDPPPLAASGPVVEPTSPSMLAMFAAAVFEVGTKGRGIDAATLDALAREHELLADRDGVMNAKPSVRLAFDLARKKTNIDAGDLVGRSLFAVMTDGMSDDLDLIIADYKHTHSAFDQAMRDGNEERAGEMKLMLEALRWHANGKDRIGAGNNERPRMLINAAAPPLGSVPMWGQDGIFEVEVDGLPALVRYQFNDWGYGPSFAYRARRFDRKFPRGGWVDVRSGLKEQLGRSVEEAARLTLRELVARHTEAKKTTADDRVGMYYPEFTCIIDPTERHDHMGRVKRGMELEAGKWPVLPAGGPWPGINSWPANEMECRDKLNAWKGSSKRGFPKPVHLATHIMMIGTRGHLVPVADFPVDEAYVYENNGRWFYVDDPTDPSAEAVAARLRPTAALPDGLNQQDLEAAYIGALATLTEPKGALHQATAEPVLRAGFAAKVPVRKMAEDLGHKLGTVQSWTHRLGLTDPNRSPIAGAAE